MYGQICLGATMLGKALYVHHFTDQDAAAMVSSFADPSALQGWTRLTWVPILTQAWGGIIVGLVTKHAGGVKKGFALIAGIALTAFVQAVVQVGFGLWISSLEFERVHVIKAPIDRFTNPTHHHHQIGHPAPAAALDGGLARGRLHLHALGLWPRPVEGRECQGRLGRGRVQGAKQEAAVEDGDAGDGLGMRGVLSNLSIPMYACSKRGGGESDGSNRFSRSSRSSRSIETRDVV